VLGGIGGFAGLWRLAGDLGRAGVPTDPVLAAASDGVGTKLLVAQALDRHDTVGIDLVAMVVDDVVVPGAEPLFVLDYLAVGRVDPARVAAIVGRGGRGLPARPAAPCSAGRRPSTPGAMAPEAYDLAGFALGMVERDRLLGPDRVVTGDVLLGLASSGLHANGFSLARQVLARAGIGYDRDLAELGARSARPCSPRPASTPPTWSTCSPPGSRSTPSATSPAAASPATSPAASPPA
jgi:phosphoribosylformylglycinamidine cyclo-ligase